LFTGLAVPPRYWDTRSTKISSGLPPAFGDAVIMNMQLQKMIRIAEDTISYALQQEMQDPVAFLRQVFHPEFDPATLSEKAKQMALEESNKVVANQDFFFQVDDYIKSKSRKVSTGMLRTYQVMKKRLLAFQKWHKEKITFSSFDFNFYEAFVNYLTYEHMHMRRNIAIRGLKRNSVGTSIKQLRIFLRDRMRRKIIPVIDLSDFKILDEETDAIYLSVDEIRILYNLDLSGHPEWTRFRDLFVLGSFTGLRFSDFNGIKPEDIRNGMLYKKQGKSDHWVVIPLRPEAHDILMNRFKRMVPQTSNAELNRYIIEQFEMPQVDLTGAVGLGIFSGIISLITMPEIIIPVMLISFIGDLFISVESRRAKRIIKTIDSSRAIYEKSFEKLKKLYSESIMEHADLVKKHAKNRFDLYFYDLRTQINNIKTNITGPELKQYESILVQLRELQKNLAIFDAEVQSYKI